MKILVDADSCPVKELIIHIAREFSVPVILFTDTTHILSSSGCSVVTVEKGADSADIALVNYADPQDVAVTNDYGLAALLLGKQVFVMNSSGFQFTQENIDRLLFERHIAKEIRQHKKRGFKKMKPRTQQDNIDFKNSFSALIKSLLNKESR